MNIIDWLEIALVDLEKKVDNMTTQEKEEARVLLEGVAKKAGMIAGYLDERQGYGYGDQGHNKAVKRLNRNGKMIWMKVFGYTAFHELQF